ncbi:hypothetical protein [Mycolicibacterium thermoresistibile]|uniref:Uncharacterized protein n=1 Tax=Mycolicibacterium thermoresistibile TaxID=1797 RepID=A0A100XGK6_MYCTH|nr:hypothetical protein [Mycolicibacterium thermoresistibile]MCV7187026.1 hypothetical protein [Mycolicibacterium thermoresistibile]GAT16279.1 uncharacterized protein RMCT_3248 [Mycolicibacterium thermoresistibile]
MASEPDLRAIRRRSWSGDPPAKQPPPAPRPPVSIRELVDALTELAERVGWDAPVEGRDGDPVQVVDAGDGRGVGVF